MNLAEVIRHEHIDHTDSGSGFGFLLGAILVVAVLALLVFWGIPALRGGAAAPATGGTGGVNINVPQGGATTPAK